MNIGLVVALKLKLSMFAVPHTWRVLRSLPPAPHIVSLEPRTALELELELSMFAVPHMWRELRSLPPAPHIVSLEPRTALELELELELRMFVVLHTLLEERHCLRLGLRSLRLEQRTAWEQEHTRMC